MRARAAQGKDMKNIFFFNIKKFNAINHFFFSYLNYYFNQLQYIIYFYIQTTRARARFPFNKHK